MTRTTTLSIVDREDDREVRERMGRVRVLIADRDMRTAALVQKLLFSFGVRNIDLVTDGEEALEFLKSRPYDFLITEWNMHPFDGLTLVKTIRTAREDKRIRRDIPILMLTARAEMENVQAARDAGITEFVVKPFTAKAISARIIQIIDNPRMFVETGEYAGPCRRRRGNPPPGIAERRLPRADTATISPPDFTTLDKLGVDSMRQLIDEHTVSKAHAALIQAEDDCVRWAHLDIQNLAAAFLALEATPDEMTAQLALKDAALGVAARADAHGYALGSEVSAMLVGYVASHPFPNANHMRVIEKHIDTIRVVFNHTVEQNGQQIARDVIASLKKLISKLE